MIENLSILGAGASYDAGAPLMFNFLDVAEDLLLTDKFRDRDEFTALFNKIKSLNSVQAKSNIDLNNIESVLGLLEMSELLEFPLNKENNEFKSLKVSYIKMIAETLEQSMRYRITGPREIIPQGSYQNFVDIFTDERKRNSSAIISFNYDLGIDVALHNVGVNYSYYLDSMKQGFPLLKLHGSINWYKHLQQGIKGFHIQDFFKDRHYTIIGRQNSTGIISFHDYINDLRNRTIDESWETTPFIIPPTWNKTMYHESISAIWRKASSCLSEAKNIIVIGYSLPETDSFFKYLFSLGTNSTTRIRKFWVINPDKNGTEERYKKLLGPQMLDRFKYIDHDFATALSDINNWA